jgi:putative oxidoreductase
MKTIFSAKSFLQSNEIPLLILRLTAGILMIPHGYSKWVDFAKITPDFMNFLGLGSTVSLSLCIFAELACSLFFALGIFTRLSCIPLIINGLVMVCMAHEFDIFGKGQLAFFYLTTYLVVFLLGPGKWSLDSLLFASPKKN